MERFAMKRHLLLATAVTLAIIIQLVGILVLQPTPVLTVSNTCPSARPFCMMGSTQPPPHSTGSMPSLGNHRLNLVLSLIPSQGDTEGDSGGQGRGVRN